MSYIIFTSDYDTVSFMLYNELKKRNVNVQLFTEQDLTFARVWNHEIAKNGIANTFISMADGRVIESTKIRGVFNRIMSFQMNHFIDFNNRSYAIMEQTALFLSFLKSLGKSLYEPLETDHLSLAQNNKWMIYKYACASGLQVANMHYSSSPRKYGSYNNCLVQPEDGSLTSQTSVPLVGLNKPALYTQHFKKKIKAVVIDNKLTVNLPGIEPGAIEKFSSLTKKKFFELHFGICSSGTCLYDANFYPPAISLQTVRILANDFMKQFK